MKRHNILNSILLLSIFLVNSAFGTENVQAQIESIENIEHKLKVSNETLDYTKQTLESTQDAITNQQAILASRHISKDDLDQARLNEAKAEANEQSIRISLVQARQSVGTIESAIASLGDALQAATLAPSTDVPIQNQIKKLKGELSYQQSLLALEQSRLKILRENYEVSQQQTKLQKIWVGTLNAMFHAQQESDQIEALDQQKVLLQKAQHDWLIKLSTLNQAISALQKKLRSESDSDTKIIMQVQHDALRLQRVEADERSNLTQIALLLLGTKQQIATLAKEQGATSVYALRNGIAKINSINYDLQQLKKLYVRKISLLDLRREIAERQLQQPDNKATKREQQIQLYNTIKKDYLEQEKQTDALTVQMQEYLVQYKQNLNRALARRQVLPSFSAKAWEELGMKIADMPEMTFHAFESLRTQVVLSMNNLTYYAKGWLVFFHVLLFGLWLEGRTVLSKLASKIKARRTALGGETLYVLVELIRRNWLSLLLITAFFSWFVFSDIPLKSYSILLMLILVWTAFRLGIGLTRLTLLEGTAETAGHDVRLYRGLKWSMILGGTVTTCTILAHQLPVTYEVSDFFNRILMVFFVGFGLFLLLKLRILPTLLAPHLARSRPYVRHLIKLLSVLIPLAMLSNAIIGLLGYIQIAWTISKHEIIFLCVLTLYVLTRGILIDAMSSLAGFIIRNLRNGWLWTEAILKPVDRLLRLALLAAAVLSLSYIYGWHDSEYILGKLEAFFNVELFKVGNSGITPLILIKLAAISMIIYWSARWSKEFAYRWLFARTKDVGMRNSLAAMFQYSTVAIGIYIGLQVLEIDWTGLKFMLVAFAAGLGFGLRDTANNMVSGLLLLFERPVRKGDIVTISSHEGEVIHVGIRSLILHTWDHMDVLVPNSEIYSKSFVNWTRQDPIIRTTVEVKVHRDDDPRRVRALIEQILVANSDVLVDPLHEVIFTNVSSDLITIEVRYHINLQNSKSRVGVRSDILFAIWKSFKQAGIRAPYTQQDVYIRSLPGSKPTPTPGYDFSI